MLEQVAVEANGSNLVDVRARIKAAQAELATLRAVPIASPEIRRRVEQYVHSLGRPRVTGIGEGETLRAIWPGDGQVLPAHVGPARIDAQALDVARRAVRYVAPAAHQSRCSRRRDEDDDQFTCRRLAPLRIFCVSCSGVSRASSPERRRRARMRARPSTQNILHPAFWLVAGEDAVRSRATKTANNHACTLECGA